MPVTKDTVQVTRVCINTPLANVKLRLLGKSLALSAKIALTEDGSVYHFLVIEARTRCAVASGTSVLAMRQSIEPGRTDLDAGPHAANELSSKARYTGWRTVVRF
jgi:hypothetical protein